MLSYCANLGVDQPGIVSLRSCTVWKLNNTCYFFPRTEGRVYERGSCTAFAPSTTYNREVDLNFGVINTCDKIIFVSNIYQF